MNHIKARLKIFLLVFVGIMVVGTVGFALLEDKPFLDAAYFVIVTMATVGYGDIVPFTKAGRVFAILLVVTGVGTFLGVIANVTEIMLARREIESRMEKLNMVIGAFFSEAGLYLIARFTFFDAAVDSIRARLAVTAKWNDADFDGAKKALAGYPYTIEMERVNLAELKTALFARRDFLLRLLENPVLLEHQSFTDLLRAVFHLTEELAYRDDVSCLPRADVDHLAGDIRRCYQFVVAEWLDYMKYLKNNYPFLFSLALRTNPFDPGARVVIDR